MVGYAEYYSHSVMLEKVFHHLRAFLKSPRKEGCWRYLDTYLN